MNMRSFNQGFSLIEVLITIVLISIGILGMVAMQAKTITYTQDSVQRNAAATLADDLMEMMRADNGSVSNYYKASGNNFPDAPQQCMPLPNDSAQRLGCWAQRAKDALPDAASLLAGDFVIAKTGTAVRIQLAWRVKDGECMDASAVAGSDKTICHYSLTAEL